jgi:hypothetical protein
MLVDGDCGLDDIFLSCLEGLFVADGYCNHVPLENHGEIGR